MLDDYNTVQYIFIPLTVSHLRLNELCSKQKNNLDELVNIPTIAKEKSVIQILFWTQDSNIKTGTILNPLQNSQLIHDPLCFQNPRICSIYHKNPQSVRFLRPNPSIRKPIHPPPNK